MGDPSSFLGVAADPRFCSVSELQAQVSLAEVGFYGCVIHLIESDQMFTLTSVQLLHNSLVVQFMQSQLVTNHCVNGSSKLLKRPRAHFNAVHI